MNKTSMAFRKTAAVLMFFCIVLNVSAYTWKPVVVPAGGAIQDIVYSKVSQNLIYMRTDMGGAYRWDNTNSVWIPLTDWLGDWNLYGTESIAPDPKNANVVYATIGQSYNSSNGYIIASSDQGNSWTQYSMPVIIAGNDSGNYAGERLAVDPDNTSILYYGSRSGGLWKSTNSGVNWSRVTAFPVNGDAGHGLSYVIFDPASATGSGCNNIYVGARALNSGNSNIYRSTNGGANWSVISGGPSGMTTCQASLGTDGNLWIVYGNDNSSPTTGQIWKLNTSILGWSNVTPSIGPASGAGGYSGICVDSLNSQHAVVSTWAWWGGTDKCFQTTNGGTSWTIIANAQNNWNSGPYPVYNINGAPWTRFCSAYDGGAWFIACVKIDPFNSNNAVYTTGGGLWSTKNVLAATQPQGITWTFTDYGIEQTAVLFLNPSYKSGVFFSCLGDISGMRYTNLDAPAPNKYCNPSFGNTNCLDYAENNTNIVARVGHSGSVASDTAFSTDNGQNWTPGAVAPPGYGTSNQMRSCAVAADGSRVIVCPYNGYGNPAYTTNSGASWTTCNGLPSGSDLASDRVNASVFFATNGSNLYRSADGGANFSVVNSFSGNGAPRPVFGMTGEVWVATGNGLYRFTNNGSTMTTISNISSANSVGFGKAAPAQTHPAVYLTGNVSGTYGFYRCDDGIGTSWLRINDNNHQYGYGGWCGGDQVVYGRMYVGTNGRGTLYCDSAVANTPTNTPASTNTFTPTRTATRTITPQNSATNTGTPSRTATLTATPLNSVTNTGTPSRTATGTATQMDSATNTRTPSRTATNTATQTVTTVLTQTFTRTMSVTPSVTGTATVSSTESFVPSSTRTASPTMSASATAAMSLTPYNTNTWTDTVTPGGTETRTKIPTGTPAGTNTITPSLTRTLSNTATLTSTLISTATGSATPSVSSTASLVPSFTPTPTATQTRTASVTPALTLTLTLTSIPTSTQTQTIPQTPNPTPSLTPTVVIEDNMEILSPVLYSNPYSVSSGNLNISFDITRPAETITVRIYTTGFRKVVETVQNNGPYLRDTVVTIAPSLLSKLASGVYYAVIKGEGSGGNARSRAVTLVVLR